MGLLQQRRSIAFIFLFLFFTSLIARGDGKVFTRAVAMPVNTPDQRALLYCSNGVERLVIETSFVGEGTNFAWVVPLPSVPKVEAVSEHFFANLNSSYQPILIHTPTYFAHLCIFLGAVLSVSLYAYRRGGRSSFALWLLLLSATALLFVMAIPNFVKARGISSSVPAASVKVLDQQTVGIYNTVTLSSTDGSELLNWLNTHQFHTPTNALPVLAQYAAKGWVFVAASINRDEEKTVRSQPHPLAFTFETAAAVYPLQLTGIENGTCTIELFVFGPNRAEADHFQAEYCGKPFTVQPTERDELMNGGSYQPLFAPPEPREFRLTNPDICKFALPAPVTTKLVGKLTPKQMDSDAWIRWVPFKESVPILHSREAAKSRAFDWFVGVAVIGLLIIQLQAPRLSARSVSWSIVSILAIGSLAGLIRFGSLEVTEVKILQGGYNGMINNWRMLCGAMDQYAIERKTKEAPLTFEELTTSMTNYLRGGAGVNNPITDKPLLNEPSPGNITLLESTNGTDVFWYDINGIPHWMITFEHKTR